MSEFQQYQFQTIDQPLTEEQRKEVNSWSSRAVVTSTSATFVYHYGDFRQDEVRVLEHFFDAMLYVANWGTKRLMFRFPLKLLPVFLRQHLSPIIPLSTPPSYSPHARGKYKHRGNPPAQLAPQKR